MSKQIVITESGLKKIKEELDYLKNVKRREAAESVGIARDFGDLSENSEYDEAKNEQGKLHSRIAELEHIIANTVIIDEAVLNAKNVEMGTTVRIRFLADDREDEYSIVGSQEANPMKKLLSDESPLGKALVGHKEGDTVKVDAPAGSFKCKILTVSKS